MVSPTEENPLLYLNKTVTICLLNEQVFCAVPVGTGDHPPFSLRCSARRRQQRTVYIALPNRRAAHVLPQRHESLWKVLDARFLTLCIVLRDTGTPGHKTDI